MPLFARARRAPDPWLRPHGPAATPEDIFYCFRLLLGRSPHREEWAGHSARAGEDLSGVVAGYANSLECARRALFRPGDAGDVALAAPEGFRIFASPSDPAVGRHVLTGRYEPEVTAVFRRVLRPGMAVADIGANIGYFTMLAASIVGAAGHVLAVEPNPRNARLLEASRRANGFGQVTVAQVAAGRETGLLVLHATDSNGTTSALSSDDPAVILGSETVPCLRVDDLLPPDRRVGLIKVDVEGAEYNALLGCRRTLERDRPVVVSEFSPDLMPGVSGVAGEAYLRWLLGLGYRLSVIQPDGSLLPAPAEGGAAGAAAAVDTVMAAYAARGTDHVDILAEPVQPPSTAASPPGGMT